MNNLLVHGDPGARSRFIAAWLLGQLDHAGFDVGSTARPKFRCIHFLKNVEELKNFSGPKIRVRFTFDQLPLHLLLFLRKNVHTQIPNFTKNEFDLETFSKLYVFAKECWSQEQGLDYRLYNYVINFEDTFDIDKLIELYNQVNGHNPSKKFVEQAVQNNKLNQIDIDPNHAASIAALLLETETRLNLQERHRRWSITELYANTSPTDLYTTIQSTLCSQNY